jgi:hypothetical protein
MGFWPDRRATLDRVLRVVITSGRDHVKLRAKLTIHFDVPQTPDAANALADLCESRLSSVLRQSEHHESLLGHESDIVVHVSAGVPQNAHVRAIEVDLSVAGSFASSATRRKPSDASMLAVSRAQTLERAAEAQSYESGVTRKIGRFDRSPTRFTDILVPVVESEVAALAVSCLLSEAAVDEPARAARARRGDAEADRAATDAVWHEARCAVTALALLQLLDEGCPQPMAIEIVEQLGHPIPSADMARYLAAPEPCDALTAALELLLRGAPAAAALGGELDRIRRELTEAIRSIGGPA